VAPALWATGVLGLDQALHGFGDPTVIVIASLFVVTEALESAGVTAWAGDELIARVGPGRRRRRRRAVRLLLLGARRRPARAELVRRAVPLGEGARRAVAVLVAMVVLLATGAVPPAAAGLLAAGALIVLGVPSIEEAYRGVSWTTVILVAGMIPRSRPR
jgi:di/tricarboxylate transporter